MCRKGGALAGGALSRPPGSRGHALVLFGGIRVLEVHDIEGAAGIPGDIGVCVVIAEQVGGVVDGLDICPVHQHRVAGQELLRAHGGIRAAQEQKKIVWSEIKWVDKVFYNNEVENVKFLKSGRLAFENREDV